MKLNIITNKIPQHENNYFNSIETSIINSIETSIII